MASISHQQWLDHGVGLLLIVLGAICALHALMHKRDARSAVVWIALCLLLPLIGAVSYLLLGVNRAERKAQSISGNASQPPGARFATVGDGAVRTPPPPTHGNHIEPCFDAENAYRDMLTAVARAQQSVLLSQYIFESRGIGHAFIEALGEAVSRGVAVYVILDKVGALYSVGSTRRKLRRVGVNVVMFLPATFGTFGWHFNLRNHRKILVVDDLVAFTGGMNIRNGYLPTEREGSPSIRDTQFRCEGPVVGDLASVFRDDWQYATGQSLARLELARPASGNAECRVTTDGPDNSVDLLSVTLLAAIATAKHRVRILMPYFLPPHDLMSGLQAAAIRGIKIDIVIPKNNNLRIVHWAMQHTFSDLLRYDICIYLQHGRFDHSKLITIDDDRCVFGSVNVDARSLRLNFELAVEAWSIPLNAKLNAYIDERMASAEALSLNSLRRNPYWVRLRNALAWLGTPYL